MFVAVLQSRESVRSKSVIAQACEPLTTFMAEHACLITVENAVVAEPIGFIQEGLADVG